MYIIIIIIIIIITSRGCQETVALQETPVMAKRWSQPVQDKVYVYHVHHTGRRCFIFACLSKSGFLLFMLGNVITIERVRI